MKKNVFILSLIFFSLAYSAEAKVWRLNNQPGVSADFKTTLQNAIDSISNGDTIYVEQSPFNYGGAIISKKVILIGSGYWLEENDSTQASSENSRIEDLKFNSGSEGSTISGFYIYKQFPHSSSWKLIEVNTDSITIQRNYIYGVLDGCNGGGCSGYDIAISGNRKAILIQQNWIESWHGAWSSSCIFLDNIPENVTIRNNFIRSLGSSQHNGVITETTGHANVGLFIRNNILWGEIFTYNQLIVNNIMLSGSYYNGSSGLAANNLCNETQFPASNNNQQNVNMATVFVDHDKYIDNGYTLVPGSPAIGAGFNGGDCGVFTNDFGGNPYVLSGMPDIPAIFGISLNSTIFPTDVETLDINIKAKAHN